MANCGDIVWAKVAGYGFWPAQVYDESLATSRMKRDKKAGTIPLSFFGDNSYGWFQPATVEPFMPSLELHRKEKTKYTKRVRQTLACHRQGAGSTGTARSDCLRVSTFSITTNMTSRPAVARARTLPGIGVGYSDTNQLGCPPLSALACGPWLLGFPNLEMMQSWSLGQCPCNLCHNVKV